MELINDNIEFFSIILSVILGVFLAETVTLVNQFKKRIEIVKYISHLITLMFHNMENPKKDTMYSRTSLESRLYSFHVDILQLKDLTIMNAIHLKSIDSLELILHLNNMDEDIRSMKRSRQLPLNSYFEKLLNIFKELTWLKIEIKELNFKTK